MLGWLGDLGRLFWGLLYWNLRKTLFRIRGASGVAPCQHPSDSGRAGETGCEACAGWNDAGRFRRMCPLLAVSGGRRVCSVGAPEVRPFWGRAVLIYAGSLAALSLAAVIVVFASFRAIGYRVPLYAVAWPPAWHRVSKARADYFYRMALRTLEDGDVRRSFLALGQVHALDPDNDDASRLLAQFTEITNPEYSDGLYAGLVFGHRGDFEKTAQVWLHAVLSRGDLRTVAGLSARMLRDGGTNVPAWTQGLLFAEKWSGDTREVDALLAGAAPIPGEARSALSLARSIRTGSPEACFRVVQLYLGGATTPFEVYYSLSRAIEIGRPSEVVAFLEGQGGRALGAYDRESLKLDAYSALGWHDLERREIGFIMDQGASSPAVNLASGHLVRYPDAGSAARLFEILGAKPLAGSAPNAGAHVSLLCMAGVNGLGKSMAQEAEIVAKIVGGTFPAWDHVRDFFESRTPAKNPAAILPALGELPLEMVYAVTAHYRAPPAAKQPAP
jgi:hypothetical protein